MKAKIIVNMDNAAFEDGQGAELARILRRLADDVASGDSFATLRDINGNRVGGFVIIK